MNRITVIGNLVRDPELRYTTSGTAVVHFTVASDRSKKPGSATDYFECEAADDERLALRVALAVRAGLHGTANLYERALVIREVHAFGELLPQAS